MIFDDVEIIHAEMRELTLAAGVPADIYDSALKVEPDTPLDHIEAKWRFIYKVRNSAYFGVLEIWRLLPAKIWARYDEWGEKGLREQLLLRDRRKLLRQAWRGYQKEFPRAKEKSVPVNDADQATLNGVSF